MLGWVLLQKSQLVPLHEELLIGKQYHSQYILVQSLQRILSQCQIQGGFLE